MADDRRVYRTGMRWKRVLAVVLAALALLIVLALTIFFSFRKYIVYTSDGVRLEVPWLTETEVSDTTENG